jgi:NAD(P)H-hydrate repair Nnr-like enzyme with NAD(P)H-hydrate dehydratase domain
MIIDMKSITEEDIQKIYIPLADSHKGQNGKLLIIGGSQLFHAASLWALTVASRIVDLVHYASVPENNEIVQKAKEQFRNGIVVARADIHDYIKEDDCILIGPGMTRDKETEELTNSLLKRYPQKQWVIDAGALQMMDIRLIPPRAILTPHHGEFDFLIEKDAELGSRQNLFDPLRASQSNNESFAQRKDLLSTDSFPAKHEKRSAQILPLTAQHGLVQKFANRYSCIVVLKGPKDIVCSSTQCREVEGGNAGMTKGGTGDVLAGLIAALACKNDPYLAAITGSYINKMSGNALYETMGLFFNSSDLADQIPKTMKHLLLK